MGNIFAYVDGGYLRELGADLVPQTPWLEPWRLIQGCFPGVQQFHPAWFGDIDRLSFYDAEERDPADGDGVALRDYLDAVEALPHCSVRTGYLTGGRQRRQKAVDVLLSVEMLVDAQARNFDHGILLAGDGDFVPLVNEVRRQGRRVAVVAHQRSLADELRRAADEIWTIPDQIPDEWILKPG